MELALILAMCLFALSMSISPGPVNMVIVASGASHGFYRTLPFVSGATLGFTLLLVFVGFWFVQMIERYPLFFRGLGIAGSLFIIHVGYTIATARPRLVMEKAGRPSFLQGFLLQWLNPKAWIACASGAALFSSPQTHAPLVAFVVIYFVVCYLSLAAWAVLGERIAVVLSSDLRMRLFNLAMGITLIATAGYMLWQPLFAVSPASAS